MTDHIPADLPPTDFINLGVGHPADSLLPWEVMAQAARHRFGAAPEQADPYFLQYGDDWGDPGLRAALAGFLMERYGLSVPESDLMISSGVTSGLVMVCQNLAQPGDRVLCESPTYYAAPDIMRAHGLEVVAAPVDSQGLRVEDLEPLIREHRPRFVYTIPAHHNPAGVTMPLQRRRALVALAQQYDFLIVADEVYHLLTWGAAPPPPFSGWADTGQVLSLGTFSKILAPGLRVGWIHAAPALLQRLAQDKALVSAGGHNPLGGALVRSVLELGLLGGYLDSLNAAFAGRSAALCGELQAQGLSDFVTPQGGYFVWVRLPGGLSADALAPAAQRAGVGFKPGQMFTLDGGGTEHIRLCFAFNDEPRLRAGARRLGAAVRAAQGGGQEPA